MARLTIETAAPISQEAINAIISFNPPGKHGQPVRRNKIGSQQLECGTLTLPPVRDMLDQFGISVKRITRGRKPFADQVIFDRRAEETYFARSRGNKSRGAGIDMNNTAVLAPSDMKEGKGRKTMILFDTVRARESFTKRLCQVVGETRGKALAQAAAFVSDAVNYLGSKNDPRRVYPWHLMSIKTEMDKEEKKSKVSLAPLDDIAPRVAKAIWDYVHSLERGRATVDAAFEEFEEAIWNEISNIPDVLEMLKNLSDPKQ